MFRYNDERADVAFDNLAEEIPKMLEKIQNGMYEKAKSRFDSKIRKSDDWEGFISQLNERNVVLTPWC